eukprot:TRINITY_DN6574_c1_g2_i1.p1 TRINITY_DN6574_c1_g2~~TRINITY_DN6574_c1_g2_i1.p1  ORF type:complete len:494 (+),score=95.66 TRINITY_DN6574_c1_g2_i1:110-1591(+)
MTKQHTTASATLFVLVVVVVIAAFCSPVALATRDSYPQDRHTIVDVDGDVNEKAIQKEIDNVAEHAEIDGELKAVLVLTRHGDRTPVRLFPKTASEWPEGLGQLTPLGMKQHFELGQKFRRRYIDKLHLFGPSYNAHEVYARSTSKERTLMSAQAFMHGLFPPGSGPDGGLPGNLQLVPVHAEATKEDKVLLGYKNCPALDSLKQGLREGQQWKVMENKTQSLREKLSQIYGFQVKLKDINSLNTLSKCERIHNRTGHSGISEDMKAEMQEVTSWLFKNKFAHPEMGRLGGGNLLHEIAKVFAKHLGKNQGKNAGHKFTLLSAHDGTILALFAAMSAQNFTIPKYAEYLHFELYEHKDSNGQADKYTVRMFYNDAPFAVHECQHKCTLGKFTAWAEKVRYENWHEVCGKTCAWSPATLVYGMRIEIAIAGALVAGMILMFLGQKVCSPSVPSSSPAAKKNNKNNDKAAAKPAAKKNDNNSPKPSPSTQKKAKK